MTVSLTFLFAVVVGILALLAVGALFGVREVQSRVSDLDYRIRCNNHDLRRMSEDVARLEIRVDDCIAERAIMPYSEEDSEKGEDSGREDEDRGGRTV